MEEILSKRIEDCSIEELSALQSKIFKEIERKKVFEEEKCWRKVIDALKEYTEIYGPIEVEDCGDTLYIEANASYDEMGRIEL